MRLNLRTQLTAAFLTLALLLIGVGLFSISQLNAISQGNADIASSSGLNISFVGRIKDDSDVFRVAQFTHNNTRDPTTMAAVEMDMQAARSDLADAVRVYDPTISAGQERDLFDSFKVKLAAYLSQNDQVFLPLSRNNDKETAGLSLQGPNQELFAGLNQTVLQLLGLKIQQQAAASSAISARLAQSSRLVVGVMALSVVIAVTLGLLLSRRIGGALNQVTAAARRMARGDLTQTLTFRSEDELGDTAQAFRDMAAYLREVTAEIQEGATGLSSASSDMRGTVAELSTGTSEQAAAIAQTTATVEQVKASAQQAVQLALVVSDAAREALRVAGQGVQAAQHASAGMADLHTRVEAIALNILALSDGGQKIGEIIAGVNDLADRSNLLALNAALEASRAGEQGRGFTVVASEIRKLAEQSKAHTARVRRLLGDIQLATRAAVLATQQGTAGVETGTHLVEQTEQTIDQLTAVIQQASASAQQIATSVQQHSVGMDQIAVAIGHIHGANARNVDATASTRVTAEALSELSTRLNRVVAQYQV